MVDPRALLHNNRRWANRVNAGESGYFRRLAGQKTPEYLWIGCSDARVPATQIVDLAPGEIFVHRNLANLVIHSDLSCLSAMQFATDVLSVRHIIVCGHYDCSGITASIRGEQHGLVDNWLRHVRDVYEAHQGYLDAAKSEAQRNRLLTEFNVVSQVKNVAATTIVQKAWSRGQELTVHGWIYDVSDSLVHDLDVSITAQSNIPLVVKLAVNRIIRGDTVPQPNVDDYQNKSLDNRVVQLPQKKTDK